MIDDQIKKKAVDLASKNFAEALSCSESVFYALICTDIIDVPEECVAMATAFGGGIALSGNTCGALIAAEMALGSIWGFKNPYSMTMEQRQWIPRNLKLRRFNNLVQDFKSEFESVNCQEICDSNGFYGSDKCKDICRKIVPYITGRVIDYINIDEKTGDTMPYGYNIMNLK
ncbi:C-GCAxxG-C-C family protein [Fusibacter ferrireducens]|uniref:C_GCAxxG_C_C family protein n=1 Tax=Fusibacter ferrireducens TaxID=2785058 RepID=A0ABR9ZNZ3_9FIRM|nr:C-GCAxxG-C-C family protein [Fusibacter ferrireducens]MBF4692187.1 C_GCAxxG_C_C family protein [Fusibacter ferrireducens]